MIVIWMYGSFSTPSFQDEKLRHLCVCRTLVNHPDKLTENSVLEINSAFTWLLTSNNFWNKKKVRKHSWLHRRLFSAKTLTFYTDTSQKKSLILESVIALDTVGFPERTHRRP